MAADGKHATHKGTPTGANSGTPAANPQTPPQTPMYTLVLKIIAYFVYSSPTPFEDWSSLLIIIAN